MAVPPWLVPPNFLGAIQSGAQLGLQIRAQRDAENRAAAQLLRADRELMYKAQEAAANRQLQAQENAIRQQSAMEALARQQQNDLFRNSLEQANLDETQRYHDMTNATALQKLESANEMGLVREQGLLDRLNQREDFRDSLEKFKEEGRNARLNDILDLRRQNAEDRKDYGSVTYELPDGSKITRRVTSDEAEQLQNQAEEPSPGTPEQDYLAALRAQKIGAKSGQVKDGLWVEGASGLFNKNKSPADILRSTAPSITPKIRARLQKMVESEPEHSAVALPTEQVPASAPEPAPEPVVAPTESRGNRVRVISPDGKVGTIPESQLEAALKRGFKRA